MRMPHWPNVPWNNNIKYNLDNIRNILLALGSPHIHTPPVIHIAGTNGKGSTVAMLKAIFEAGNYKVHTYTSPHLIDFNERIVLAGEMISDQYLFEICERTRLVCEKLNLEPRFFEAITAASFIAFAEIQADILIVETGLGGRLDATNIVNPILTLITPISYDHMEYLGNSLIIIANEKAGIIKPNTPCVISLQAAEIYDSLLNKCNELASPAFCFDHDFTVFKNDNDSFSYITKTIESTFPMPSLLGDHQLINAASVIASVTLVNQKFQITKQQIAQGLQNTRWSARIEKIAQEKYQYLIENDIQIWLDGAHNSHGAQILAQWIRTNLSTPIYLILGMTKNRNIEDFCQYFSGLTHSAYTVKVISEPLSYSAAELATRATTTDSNFYPAEDLTTAIKLIDKSCAKNTKANIIICGSLFLAADFIKLLQR